MYGKLLFQVLAVIIGEAAHLNRSDPYQGWFCFCYVFPSNLILRNVTQAVITLLHFRCSKKSYSE